MNFIRYVMTLLHYRLAKIIVLCCLVSLTGAGLGEARIFRPWSPEELDPKATVICNGTVLDLQKIATQDSTYPNINPSNHHEIVMSAKIKVLHVFKGDAPTEIEFRYRVSDPSIPEINGAMHCELTKGGRYRFFLKPGSQPGQYVGVLDGEFDDNFAVEILWPNEPDDSSYLSKDEAVQVVRKYIESATLNLKPGWAVTSAMCEPESEGGATWHVVFSSSLKPHEGYLGIVVRGDRTVDPKQVRVQDPS